MRVLHFRSVCGLAHDGTAGLGSETSETCLPICQGWSISDLLCDTDPQSVWNSFPAGVIPVVEAICVLRAKAKGYCTS